MKKKNSTYSCAPLKATSSGAKKFPKNRPVTLHSSMLHTVCVILILKIFSVTESNFSSNWPVSNYGTRVWTQAVQFQSLLLTTTFYQEIIKKYLIHVSYYYFCLTWDKYIHKHTSIIYYINVIISENQYNEKTKQRSKKKLKHY